MLDWKANA